LCAFEKLRKATIGFVMSVCPSVSPYVRMEQLGSNEANSTKLDNGAFFEKSV